RRRPAERLAARPCRRLIRRPAMLMYFDFRTYFRMLRLAWREHNARNRRRLLLTLLVKIPLVSSFHAVCFFLDPILFPALRRTEVKSPIFIVGHARSGTTLLHRVMNKDPGRFSSFLLWELSFPSLLQKKLIRWCAAVDRQRLGGVIERRIRAWEERKFGPTRHIHFMSLTEPEEDDGVLAYSCASGTWIVRLPYMGELDFYHIDRRPVRDRRRLMTFYKECVRRQLCLNGGDKIHLSKNPTFAGRVESLIETFADARIVVPFRNPYETIPSLLKLMKVAWAMRKWSDAEMQRSLRILAEQSYHTYKYPLEVLARHPQTPHAVVDYDELVAEPKRTIEKIYRELGLPMTPEYESVLSAEQEQARRHRGSHAYGLDEFGLSGGEIRAALGDLFERFHWQDVPPERG
ncbi:MAG TPA: sulfotransferase, partial [Candidatus Binatia bacterium]|nr:sulfotransferase [Candidatus Binatia bacterium]